MNPFQRLAFPRLKLAGTYLAIIMIMSLIFSFAIYQISERELLNQRQLQVPRNIPVSFIDEFENLREIRFEQGVSNLRGRLVVFNLVVLISGSLLSYALALRALKPIEEVMEAQSRFTSDASHEIRTPLTVMKSEIEVALRDMNLTVDEARETLNSNLEEITKLENLTSGLLQLSRQEKIELNKEKIEVVELLKQAISQVKPAAKRKKIKLVTDLKKDFSLTAEPQTIKQVLVILLDNAIKYSPDDSTVTLTAKNIRNAHLLVVRDNGQGIDPADLPHIFDRFYRSDKARTKGAEASGYGLGLAIAKQIIDAHNGTINLTSKPEKGTQAQISLPKK